MRKHDPLVLLLLPPLLFLIHDTILEEVFLRLAEDNLPIVEKNLDEELPPYQGIDSKLRYTCLSGCDDSQLSSDQKEFSLSLRTKFILSGKEPSKTYHYEIRYF